MTLIELELWVPLSPAQEQVQRLTDGMGRLRRSLSMSHDIIHEKQATIDRLTERLQSKRHGTRWTSTSEAAIQCHIHGCDKETNTYVASCDAGTMIDIDGSAPPCRQTKNHMSTPHSISPYSLHLLSPLSDDSLIENISSNSVVNRCSAGDASAREVICSPHRDSLNESIVQYSYADMTHSITRSSDESLDSDSRHSENSSPISLSYEKDAAESESGSAVGSPDSLRSLSWQQDVSSTVEDSFALVQHYYE